MMSSNRAQEINPNWYGGGQNRLFTTLSLGKGKLNKALTSSVSEEAGSVLLSKAIFCGKCMFLGPYRGFYPLWSASFLHPTL